MGHFKDPITDVIAQVAMQLQPETYEFTVKVAGVRYDVYWFTGPNGKDGQIAIAIIDGKAVVPMFRAGRGTEAEAEEWIRQSEVAPCQLH